MPQEVGSAATGFEAGLCGDDQIKVALNAMLEHGGTLRRSKRVYANPSTVKAW
jgi:hypothetical protein